jgi:hypothetical protein
MQSIYKIVEGAGGRCGCGHIQRRGDCYYLIDTATSAYTVCQHCGKEQGLDRWWGEKKEITAEEMSKHWFESMPIKEVVCRELRQYTRKSSNVSSKREEMLRVAVEV